MSRYQPITASDVSEGQRLRLTLRHAISHGTMTIEDQVIEVHTKHTPAHQGVLGGTIPARTTIESIEMPGWIARLEGPGWVVSTIERALPPLPTVPGSVILVDGKTAVLRENYERTEKEWVWAANGLIGPSEEQLFRADIIHTPGQ